MRLSLRALVARSLLLLGSACASTPSAPDASSTPDATSLDSGALPPCTGTELVQVRGRMVDEAGLPLEGARAQLCLRTVPVPPSTEGTLLCVPPPSTDSTGRYVVDVPLAGRCVERAVLRALAPPRAFATSYCPIDLTAAARGELAIEPELVLHAVDAERVPERGDLAATREVLLGGGLALELAPDALSDPDDYERLAATRIDPSRTCVGARYDGALALYPEAALSRPARVRIANDHGYAAGTALELSLLGGLGTTLADGTFVEEGALAAFGTAHVTANGAWIESDPGSELPYLSWLAFRPVSE